MARKSIKTNFFINMVPFFQWRRDCSHTIDSFWINWTSSSDCTRQDTFPMYMYGNILTICLYRFTRAMQALSFRKGFEYQWLSPRSHFWKVRKVLKTILICLQNDCFLPLSVALKETSKCGGGRGVGGFCGDDTATIAIKLLLLSPYPPFLP